MFSDPVAVAHAAEKQNKATIQTPLPPPNGVPAKRKSTRKAEQSDTDESDEDDGNGEVASSPASKAQQSPQLTDLKLKKKIAELEASNQIHKVAVDELNAKVDKLQGENQSQMTQ